MTNEIIAFFPSILIINSFMLCIFKPPILILVSVIIQAFMTCVLLKTLFKTAWFSLILFLIFIGGLMILFIYIISLASNNEITFSGTQINLTKLLVIFILGTFLLSLYPFNILIHPLNQINLTHFLNKIYSIPSIIPITIIIIYLLLVLLITVSVALLKSGPLRSLIKIK